MFSREQLIEVFEETRELSRGIYREETARAVKDTRVIVNGSGLLKEKGNKKQVVEVINDDMVKYLESIRGSFKVAVLNPADPYTAGGLVFNGEPTLEEHLCRCSNLYETLNKDDCYKFYYKYNRDLNTDTFSDRIIYSPRVTFFKDGKYNILSIPVLADVITCPFPLGYAATDEVLIQRIKCIIGTAYNHQVTHLVLCAIGCGAFLCNSYQVANAFKTVLDEYKLFDKVSFVIKETPGVADDNYNIFKEVFNG